MELLFCHGLESGPVGRKTLGLRAAGFVVTAPDGRGQPLAARVAAIEAELAAQRDRLVIGSSYGGLAALCAAIRHVDRGGSLPGLLLCAPALARHEPPADAMTLAAPCRTVILHGVRDEIVPIELSRGFVAREPRATLVEVDDDHSLGASLPRLVELVRELATG